MQIRENLDLLQRRARILVGGALVLLVVLGGSLVRLQIAESPRWRKLAENNRLRKVPVPSTRGRIFDRAGRLLADTVPSWRLLVFPDEVRDRDGMLAFLHGIGLGRVHELRERLGTRRVGTLAPLVLTDNMTWQQVARIRSRQLDFPGVSVVEGFRRSYPHGSKTAHAIGHLRYVTDEDLEDDSDLSPNQLVGATGVEALAEEVLASSDGQRWVVASAAGRQLGVVREEPGTPGTDLAVTLDLTLQTAAFEALGDRSGAVVALDPRTGAVRALVSTPSFDPNIFSSPLSGEVWSALVNDPSRPLQDRAIQGTYPPGSTVKPFLLLGGLAEGAISTDWSVYCTGGLRLYNTRFRCWNRGGHGRVGLERSLVVSCDVYYYLLGQRLGIDAMASWFGRFGLGRRSGIGLPNENSGLVGTPEWKMRVRGQRWYAGESVSVSIGQGPVTTTVLQMARAYAALANGGRLVTPHLIQDPARTAAEDLALDAEALDRVVRSLWGVTHDSEGTARSLAGLPVAGKTGTAQVVSLDQVEEGEELEDRFQHHAWFVGWGPVAAPEIVVAVLVEHGGGGGAVAAPTARRVFEAAFGGDGSSEGSGRGTPD